jgi:two-component system OmpR family sensor kinase
MRVRLGNWLNSIQAHMILLALGTIAGITAFSVIAISVTVRPPYSPVSVYEMTRIVRGQTLVQPPRKVVKQGRVPDAPASEHESERVISRLLASRLDLPLENVRVHLRSDQGRAATIVSEARLYGDTAANPVLYGGFTIFVRQPDGSWAVFRRVVDYWQARSLRFWRYGTYYLSILVVLLLAMLFSSRLTRPVRNFAKIVDRIGAGLDDAPMPVVGPTEIRQAAVALNEMQARIVHFVEERTVLIGAIAHDLRTPLSNLRFRIANADAATCASAEEEILRMEQLISSTLDYVDGEGRPMVTEPVDVGSLLQTLTDDYRDRGEEVHLAGHEQITIGGDLTRLRRLFTNIIENALKFGNYVDVAYHPDGEHVVIDIVDDGPGMAGEDLTRAFDPFFRGERSRNRNTGGIGLGLAIAESAARAHGGTIELRNLEGGFHARVRLPTNRLPAESSAGRQPSREEFAA